MAKKIHEKTPHAKMLLVALRSVGYTNETAIADIVDNSIWVRQQRLNYTLTGTIEE